MPFQPLPPPKIKPGANPAAAREARETRRELNLSMRIGYLEGQLQGMRDVVRLAEARIDRLETKLARLTVKCGF